MKTALFNIYKTCVLLGSAFFLLPSCDSQTSSSSSTNEKGNETAKQVVRAEPIKPLSLPTLNDDMVELGNALFHDPLLSKDNTVSCASCHSLKTGGVDNKPVATGMMGKQGQINTPTVFNSGNSFKQFWDGRAETLEEQVTEPIHNPIEMGSSWEEVIGKLSKDEKYQTAFKKLFPDGVTAENIQKSIAEFERSLITPSRFDDYLLGDDHAISEQEKKGYDLFKKYGCASCHQGVNVGGNMFQRFGIARDYFEERGNITKVDYGRYNVTGEEYDRFYFKVPSLRNIALTSPYLHDGSQKTLEDIVKVMVEYQLGRDIPEEDVNSIVSFLKTLTGKGLQQP